MCGACLWHQNRIFPSSLPTWTGAVLGRQEEDSNLAARESTAEGEQLTALLAQAHTTALHCSTLTKGHYLRTGWTVCLHANTQDSDACI